ncbi:hypothetical protein D9M68_608640 [compost metagenome]
MRLRRAHAIRRTADFQRDHGLAVGSCKLQRRNQALAVLDAFEHDCDDLDRRVHCQVRDEIRRAQVELVAAGKPQARAGPVGEALDDAAACATALRDQANRPDIGGVRGEGGRERHADPVTHVRQARAVRPIDAQAGFGTERCDFRLDGLAFRAGFGKPGRHHDGERDLPARTVAQHVEHQRRPHDHQRNVNGPRW